MLWLFRKEGASEKANAHLKEALGYDRFVPFYLFGKKRLPKQLPEYIGLGDENEAIAYDEEAIKVWQKTEGFLQLLRRNLVSRVSANRQLQ